MEDTGRSIYFTPENLKKIDNARGKFVKRSTIINLMIEKADDKWLKNLLKQ